MTHLFWYPVIVIVLGVISGCLVGIAYVMTAIQVVQILADS